MLKKRNSCDMMFSELLYPFIWCSEVVLMRENCQKIKLLKLYDLLRQETDEQHPLTTMQILEHLAAMGISCERRTVAKDMAILNAHG